MTSLRRTAYALCGDWHTADDLVQVTLAKLLVAWPLRDPGAVDAWLRQTMVRALVDTTRRPWWRRERSYAEVPDLNAVPEAGDGATDVIAQLDLLPPRQCACLVLRFLQDCSLGQTAEALGCSVGTVKSQTHRGLAAIRTRLTLEGTQS